MSNHTPGPWHVGAHSGNDLARIENDCGVVIGSVRVQRLVSVGKGRAVFEWSDELYANAILIGAAPELFEIAKRLVDVGLSSSLIKDARAAIAKATGDL